MRRLPPDCFATAAPGSGRGRVAPLTFRPV
jgi:hypothetical protein